MGTLDDDFRFLRIMAVKRVLVTGASGFLGSALVRRLIAEGVHVAVLQREDKPGRRLHDVLARVEVLAATTKTPDRLRDGLLRSKPDTVFHLGWGGVASSYRNDSYLAAGRARAISLPCGRLDSRVNMLRQ